MGVSEGGEVGGDGGGSGNDVGDNTMPEDETADYEEDWETFCQNPYDREIEKYFELGGPFSVRVDNCLQSGSPCGCLLGQSINAHIFNFEAKERRNNCVKNYRETGELKYE